MLKNNVSNGEDVEMKVKNVFAYLVDQYPGKKISIVEICKLGGISRANLYSSHMHLVNLVHAHNERLGFLKPEKSQGRIVKKDLTVELRRRVKILTCLCLELKIQNESLQSRLAVLQGKRKGRG